MSRTAVPGQILVLLHAAFIGFAAVALTRRLPMMLYFGALYLLVLVDYGASTTADEPLCFVAATTASVTTATAALSLRGRAMVWFPVVSTFMMCGGVAVLHPDWGGPLARANLVTALMLICGAWVFAGVIRRFATAVDAQAIAAERDQRRVVAARMLSRELAEDARVLHDTVINTLAAVANGGSTARHVDLVRRRCHRDAVTVEALLAGRRHRQQSLEAACAHVAIPVRWSGLRGGELRRVEALLPPDMLAAIGGALAELVRNAEKHSCADHVRVDVSREDRDLVVRVSDDGVGFDPASAAGHGLAESVLRRAEDNGVAVSLRSAPGSGTCATIMASLGQARMASDVPGDRSVPVTAVADEIRRFSCWAWAAALGGVGLITELVNRHGRPALGLAVVGMVAAVSMAAWIACRQGRWLPWWLGMVVVATPPLGFVLGFIAVDSAQEQVYLWQPISLTPPLVILLVTSRRRLALILAVSALAAVAVAIAVMIWPSDPARGAVVIAAVIPQLAEFGAWTLFYAFVGWMCLRHATDQQVAARHRSERAVRRTLSLARDRWIRAGLQSSLELLQPLAEGLIRPDDPTVQRRCADEERHLRQLIQLSPDLLRLSAWLAHALTEARERGVRLTVRADNVDAPDDRTAETLGRLLVDQVSCTPVGGELTAGIFADGRYPHLLVVRPRDAGPAVPCPEAIPGWAVERSVHDGQILVEAHPDPDLESLVTTLGRRSRLG
jgi:signal transduction histidine kinase